ncbi:MAG: circadian clock KaiB family protein [Verrucomicrobiota bacterium]|nr:circadian clock KaiB family protein [Verrucomicrobiota bacterium]
MKIPPSNNAGSAEVWDLKLYIMSNSVKCTVAYSNLKRICEEHLPGRYFLEVIDLVKTPDMGCLDQVLAIPTLVRKVPKPSRRIIGDFSDTDKMLVSLDVPPLAA